MSEEFKTFVNKVEEKIREFSRRLNELEKAGKVGEDDALYVTTLLFAIEDSLSEIRERWEEIEDRFEKVERILNEGVRGLPP